MDNKYQNYYRIDSIRAQWHDYDGGTYFVTICTYNREQFFGKIIGVDGSNQLFLSEIGRYACETIEEAPQHNPYAIIPSYVVMPNHIHLIVVVDMSHVETVHAPSQTNTVQTRRWKNDVVDEKMQMISRRKNKLSFLVGSIKSNITRYANQKRIEFAWQSRFHDHIVRNIDELNNIAAYVENNVVNWHEDVFHG